MTLYEKEIPVPNLISSPDDGELNAQIALARVEAVPLRLRLALMTRFGSARGVFDASETVLKEVGLSPRHARALSLARSASDNPDELEALRAAGIGVIGLNDPRYPRRLKEVASPPLVLFTRGEVALLESPAILAVIGSRDMTDYGVKVLEDLVPPLVNAGIVLVSGLAIGIDARAHEICLRSGGKAVAVQAQGVIQGYPARNQTLYEKVISCGLVLSEFARPPAYMGPEMFPRRNRIVSGISDGVLVVEARVKSGSLVTAHFALGQNRGVYAVPGDVFRETSLGCLKLICDGAKPVSEASDVIEDLACADLPLFADVGPVKFYGRVATDGLETALEKNIFEACREIDRTIDELVEVIGASAPSVMATVTKMALAGNLAEGKRGVFRSV
jgi:DNA processing protein